MVLALRHPAAGLVAADGMDHDAVMKVATPYLGELVEGYCDWTPLWGRGLLLGEGLDEEDPWQFLNFRVA